MRRSQTNLFDFFSKKNSAFGGRKSEPGPGFNGRSANHEDPPKIAEPQQSPPTQQEAFLETLPTVLASGDQKTGGQEDGVNVQPGDILWTKMMGYPWWPAIVYVHPQKKIYYRKAGNDFDIHVQFFDRKRTRGWIKQKRTFPYTGSSSAECSLGGRFYNAKMGKTPMKSADEAINISDRQQRLAQFATCTAPSDDEEGRNPNEISFETEALLEVLDGPVQKKPVNKRNRSKNNENKSTDKAKRRRIISSSDESPVKADNSAIDLEESKAAEIGSGEIGTIEIEDCVEVERSEQRMANDSEKSQAKGSSVKRKLADSFAESEDKPLDVSGIGLDSTSSFKHLSFDFLKPENIRDANKRPPSDPDYDPRTLFVPTTFLKSQTPGLRQWWNLKCKYFDTLLLFKVGKFYELYHMDAVIAVKELNLTFMKGDYAHCGFPEIAYSRFSDQLVQRGYKVARIEQTETPEMMEKRNASRESAHRDKVVSREVCRVTSIGTKTYSWLDSEGDGAEPAYLFALREEVISASESEIGVCFVDTSIGKIYVSQFKDDLQCGTLHALLAEFVPAQILFPRRKLSSRILGLLNSYYSSVMKEPLAPGTQFWSDIDALKFLNSGNYFFDDENRSQVHSLHSIDGLKDLLNNADPLGLTAKTGKELAVSALGAVIWYLKECLIDIDVLSLKNFEEYVPERKLVEMNRSEKSWSRKSMALDGVTLKNLNVVADPNSNDSEGSLFERLNTCAAPSGKRLLNQWICHPSCHIETIKRRQSAISDLLKIEEFMSFSTKLLHKTPDIERLIQKIHSLGSKVRSVHHPDSRAVLFNMDSYNRRKVNDLLSAIEGLKTYEKIIDEFQNYERFISSSSMLKRCLTTTDCGGAFPNIKRFLQNFERGFNCDQAKKEGIIIPSSSGIDKDYDEAVEGVKSAEEELQKYLREMKSRLSCSTITYINGGRSKYILEVPEKIVSKLGDEFEFASQRKGYKRYSTKRLDELRSSLEKFEEKKNDSLKNVVRTIFANFCKNAEDLRKAVSCISVVDALMALARYAQSIDGNFRCAPEVLAPDDPDQAYISIEEGMHPCSSKIHTSAGSFISNDTRIGMTGANENLSPSLMLITGPNMGGKSTLMRQVGLITILAHVGSHVPAKSCSMTLVDRIFTRIGANDRLAAGQSTFFVELGETSCILKNATRNSLVILDELGRGTATHDGTAIASATLFDLSERVRCRTLFSTHYYSLVHEVAQNPRVSLNHMACMVENGNLDNPEDEDVTFLYKLEAGACPKSHGFFAAKLAGLSSSIIQRARDVSKLLEDDSAINFLNFRDSVGKFAKENLTDEIFLEKLSEALRF